MNGLNPLFSRSKTDIIVKQKTLIRKVYAWMGVGLAMTAFMPWPIP